VPHSGKLQTVIVLVI